MIRCFEFAQSRKKRTKKKRRLINIFELPLYWSAAKRTKKRFIEDSVSSYGVYLSCSSTLSFAPQFSTFCDKRKTKEADYTF